MSCKIIYNNQNYTIESFKDFLVKNKNLFLQDFISQDIEGFKEFVKTQPSEVYFQLSDKQKEFQKKIEETNKTIRKVELDEKADPELMGDEESNNWYERLLPDGTWERLKKRVTNRVKAWYEQKFPGKVFTDEEKDLNEFKRTLGVKYHGYIKEIHNRFFNSDGTRREKVGERPYIANETDEDVYLKLEKYFIDLINREFEGGKTPLVFSEVIIYDNVEKEPGTVDLLIVDENGKASIFDWKFLSVGKNSNDIPWFKQGAFNIQLGRYKEILMRRYGVKEMGLNRAIPILLDIDRRNSDDPSTRYLKGISIGSLNTNEIEDLRLMPVSEKSESTGFENIDKLIKRMNAIHKQLSKKDVTSDEEREYKLERLNIVKNALRYLQANQEIKPLIQVISVMRKEGEMIINDWKSIFEGKHRTGEFTNDQLSEFAENIIEYTSIANVFKDIDKAIGELIYNPSMEEDATTVDMKIELAERKDILSKVRDEAQKITNSFNEIDKISSEFADKFIGEKNLVTGLLRAEAVVKTLFSSFTGVSDLPTASLQLLYKLVSNAKAKAARDATVQIDKLLEIRKRLSKKGDLRKLVQKIYQKDDKNRSVNKLIYRYSKEFYDQIKANAADDIRSKEWLAQNVDLEAYREEAGKLMNSRIERLEKLYDENPSLREDLILQERRKWDVSRKDFIGFDNYILKRHPLQKWESQEYKELKNNPDLMELYNFIRDLNDKAEEMGYIDNRISNTFLPYVRKSFAESLTWDFGLSAIKNWGKSLELRTDDVGYGKVNEVTSEYEYTIPKYYTQDFTRNEDGTHDYTDVSEDIFKNLILYIGHMEKYKHLSDVEGQLLLVKQIETFKGHLATSRGGSVVFEGGTPQQLEGNEQNTKTFDNFLRALLYDQKYPLSEGDIPLGIGKVVTSVAKGINRLAGREIFKPDENPHPTSLIKSIDAVNRAMQLKTLGFELISGMANYFGGNIQAIAQAGNYFEAGEFLSNEATLLGYKFKSKEEREMFAQLVDTFMPLKDDPVYVRARKAGMSALTRTNLNDVIMMFMRYPEQLIEKSIFLSLLQNTMVVDGKLVNIRRHVKDKYKGRYKPGGRFRQLNKRVKDEINELKRTKSIHVTKKLENGKLVIPGLDLNNQNELQRLTQLTRRISRSATGDMSDSDINEMSMSVWTKSMMVFKNWIPKLVKTRFGKLEKVSDDFSVEIDEDGLTTGEMYDMGRMRLWLYVMGTSVRDLSTNLYNIISVNDKGLERLNEMYDEFSAAYEKRTGKQFTMSREDFYDLVRRNLANQTKELAMLLALMGATLALGLIGPDDEDATRADRNFHRYSQKVFDKFVQELSFFYNPVEFQKMLSGSMFPAIGLISDITRFMNHFTLQVTGYNISNPSLTEDEVRERAQPIKHAMKLFPGTKASLTWGSILSEEFADYFDITIQKESSR